MEEEFAGVALGFFQGAELVGGVEEVVGFVAVGEV